MSEIKPILFVIGIVELIILISMGFTSLLISLNVFQTDIEFTIDMIINLFVLTHIIVGFCFVVAISLAILTEKVFEVN